MPVLKPISGHSKSVRAAIDYLTKKERALAADYINCSEVDRRGRPTWRQMDETRQALGCDVPHGSHRRVRTYEHFVLSPDPRDHVDLATLRELATQWAREYFPNFQVAIFYHDDNELRIPHAHLIVNNANLDRPGRVSTILTPKFEAEMFAGLQRMASERGLHAFTERSTSENHAEWAKADRERAARERPKGTAQPTYVTKRDREIEGKGVSWKRDVRDRVACALRMSTTEEQFVECCRALGLGVRESASKRGGGDFVYQHPGRNTWEVSGARLGRDWSRWGVQRRLASDRQAKVPKPGDEGRARLAAAMGSLSRADGGLAMEVVGVAGSRPVTSAEVTDMLDVLCGHDVRSLADLSEAMREPMAPAERDRLRAAAGLARDLRYLPAERDRVDGRRSTFEERRRTMQAARPRAAKVGSGSGGAKGRVRQVAGERDPRAAGGRTQGARAAGNRDR